MYRKLQWSNGKVVQQKCFLFFAKVYLPKSLKIPLKRGRPSASSTVCWKIPKSGNHIWLIFQTSANQERKKTNVKKKEQLMPL